MNYIVLAHSPLTGKVFTTRIKDCDYRDVRERLWMPRRASEIYGDEYEILSIMEVPAGY